MPKNTADKKSLFIAALKVDAPSVETVAENRFRVGNNEYQVWTEEEAAEYGYTSGGIATKDAEHLVYRIF